VWRREIVVRRWRRWPMVEEGGEEGTGGGIETKEGRRRDKEGRELGFGRRSHRFIYRRAKWASWVVGPSC
jgi:hypothetical protein